MDNSRQNPWQLGKNVPQGLRILVIHHNVYYQGYQIQQIKIINILHGIPILKIYSYATLSTTHVLKGKKKEISRALTHFSFCNLRLQTVLIPYGHERPKIKIGLPQRFLLYSESWNGLIIGIQCYSTFYHRNRSMLRKNTLAILQKVDCRKDTVHNTHTEREIEWWQ